MSEYVSRILLEVNGQSFEDFQDFEEGEIELKKQFALMNGTGIHGTQPVITSKLTAVIPKDKPEFDFTQLVDGTITVDYQNGRRKTYPNCHTLRLGRIAHNGNKESTREIEIGHGLPIEN